MICRFDGGADFASSRFDIFFGYRRGKIDWGQGAFEENDP
jgi:hypothetical protein